MSPEQTARQHIDALLGAAGWHVCDAADANIHAARGVAIREFPLPGYGFADYLLYVDGRAAGVIEAKKEGATPIGVGALPFLFRAITLLNRARTMPSAPRHACVRQNPAGPERVLRARIRTHIAITAAAWAAMANPRTKKC